MGKSPNLSFSKREVKVSLEPTQSQLPSAQNNPQIEVAHLEKPFLNPFINLHLGDYLIFFQGA